MITKIRSILAAPAQEVEPGSAPAAADEVRDAALEDAARLSEEMYESGLGGAGTREAAKRIRALKTTASAATSSDGGAA